MVLPAVIAGVLKDLRGPGWAHKFSTQMKYFGTPDLQCLQWVFR